MGGSKRRLVPALNNSGDRMPLLSLAPLIMIMFPALLSQIFRYSQPALYKPKDKKKKSGEANSSVIDLSDDIIKEEPVDKEEVRVKMELIKEEPGTIHLKISDIAHVKTLRS
jgi:hypothetical protein